MSTSKRIDKTPQKSIGEEVKPYHYYITGIMEQRKYLILINTGLEENYITRELVTEDEIITTEQSCPELPKAIMYTEEITEKEIIIGGIPIIGNREKPSILCHPNVETGRRGKLFRGVNKVEALIRRKMLVKS